MLSPGWGGGGGGAPGGPPSDAAGGAAAQFSIPGGSISSSSSTESPSLQLRMLRLGTGPSLHTRGGAAAAAAAAGCTYIATVDGTLLRTEGDGQKMQLIEFPTVKGMV